jgi:cytochrome c oxidase assembly protein Cox11
MNASFSWLDLSYTGKPTRSSVAADLQERNKRFAMYMFSVVIGVGGVSYAAVPLYKAFCQATGNSLPVLARACSASS